MRNTQQSPGGLYQAPATHIQGTRGPTSIAPVAASVPPMSGTGDLERELEAIARGVRQKRRGRFAFGMGLVVAAVAAVAVTTFAGKVKEAEAGQAEAVAARVAEQDRIAQLNLQLDERNRKITELTLTLDAAKSHAEKAQKAFADYKATETTKALAQGEDVADAKTPNVKGAATLRGRAATSGKAARGAQRGGAGRQHGGAGQEGRRVRVQGGRPACGCSVSCRLHGSSLLDSPYLLQTQLRQNEDTGARGVDRRAAPGERGPPRARCAERSASAGAHGTFAAPGVIVAESAQSAAAWFVSVPSGRAAERASRRAAVRHGGRQRVAFDEAHAGAPFDRDGGDAPLVGERVDHGPCHGVHQRDPVGSPALCMRSVCAPENTRSSPHLPPRRHEHGVCSSRPPRRAADDEVLASRERAGRSSDRASCRRRARCWIHRPARAHGP